LIALTAAGGMSDTGSLRSDANNIFLSHASQKQFSPSLYQEFGSPRRDKKKNPAWVEEIATAAEGLSSPAAVSDDDALGSFINAGMTPNRALLPRFQPKSPPSLSVRSGSVTTVSDDGPTLRELQLEANPSPTLLKYCISVSEASLCAAATRPPIGRAPGRHGHR